MASLDSWKRFLASAPEAQREIRTIQIEHVDLAESYYFVQDYNDFVAEGITYKAAGIIITEPAERNDAEQSLQISMGAVTGELQDIIDQITDTGYMNELTTTYRKYYSGDLTQPAVAPLVLYGSGISFDGSERVSFSAEDTDLSNKRSGFLYTINKFPGIATE
jgi:hypothetical protein